MKKLFNKLISFDDKYKLTLTASSITFYVVISISALTILLLGGLLVGNKLFASFLINDIAKIIGETFAGLLSDELKELKLGGFSIFLFASVIYSSSSVINRLTLYADNLYHYESSSFIKIRIESVLLFTMLLLIMVFELIVIFYGKYFLNNILKINIAILNNLVTMASEIVMFYLLICIIYMYLPPKKMKFKDVSIVSLVISVLIYVILFIFKLLFNVITKLNLLNALSFVFVSISYLIFIIIYLFLIGIIYIIKKT